MKRQEAVAKGGGKEKMAGNHPVLSDQSKVQVFAEHFWDSPWGSRKRVRPRHKDSLSFQHTSNVCCAILGSEPSTAMKS